MEKTIPLTLQWDETFDVGCGHRYAGGRQGLPGTVPSHPGTELMNALVPEQAIRMSRNHHLLLRYASIRPPRLKQAMAFYEAQAVRMLSE